MKILINSSNYSYYENSCSRDDEDSSCQCDSYSESKDESANDVCSQAAATSDD